MNYDTSRQTLGYSRSRTASPKHLHIDNRGRGGDLDYNPGNLVT